MMAGPAALADAGAAAHRPRTGQRALGADRMWRELPFFQAINSSLSNTLW